MFEILTGLSLSFVPFVVIALVIYFAVNANSKSHTTVVRSIVISSVILAAVPAGLIASYYLPIRLLNLGDDAAFGMRLTIGSIMILAGVFLKNKTQRYFLLLLGLAIVLLQVPFVFSAYGTRGGLVTVAIAFMVLIIATIWLTLKGKPHE